MLAALSLLCAGHGWALAADSKAHAAKRFATATVRSEQNATDGDFEVVFEARGGDDGLAKLTVVSPDGRTVIDFTASGASRLGMRQFRFESPEPTDIASLKAGYPEGVYTFDGATAAGQRYHGTARLTHALPAPVSLLHPRGSAHSVSAADLTIKWTPVRNLAAYVLELEQEETGSNLTVRLPSTASTFAVPQGFLVPGKPYRLGIGTVTKGGNASFVETEFRTAPRK